MSLEAEFRYYVDHQNALVEKYRGRVVVIKGDKVIGDYESEPEAIREVSKTNALGTFLVQRCTPGEDSYTGVYHSRFAV